MTTTLHQFAYSHFNEKARWALDYKGVDHVRETYLPGPHAPSIRKLSGQTQTPVLVRDNEVIAGSARIIDELERAVPEPPLYPHDPELRSAALQLQEQFDAEVGPAVRTMVFSVLVNDASYLVRMFGGSKNTLKRTLYRATFPLARPMIAKANGVTSDANVQRARERTFNALDDVAQRGQATGYLVGDTFSVADLTAAALIAPISDVAHPDMSRPKPVPDAFRAMVAEFADHPGVAWVNRIYSTHRASPSA